MEEHNYICGGCSFWSSLEGLHPEPLVYSLLLIASWGYTRICENYYVLKVHYIYPACTHAQGVKYILICFTHLLLSLSSAQKCGWVINIITSTVNHSDNHIFEFSKCQRWLSELCFWSMLSWEQRSKNRWKWSNNKKTGCVFLLLQSSMRNWTSNSVFFVWSIDQK